MPRLLGAKANGGVMDAALPTEADATHAGQTRHQKGITAALAEAGVPTVEGNLAIYYTSRWQRE